MNHFRYSPSSSKRWLTCSASIIEEFTSLPEGERTDSHASRTGTQAHTIAEQAVAARMAGGTYEIPDTVNGDVGCAQPIETYVSHNLTLAKRWDANPLIEGDVELFYAPGNNGYLDFAIIKPDRMILNDLKFGQGVKVHAFENTQLRIYAASYLHVYNQIQDIPDDFIIELWITQPRMGTGEPSSWSTTWGELKVFMDHVRSVAADIEHDLALNTAYDEFAAPHEPIIQRTRYYPSRDACQFCSLKGNCKALHRKKVEGVRAVLPNAPEEKDAFYAFIIDREGEIKQALREAEDYLLQRLNAGAVIPGMMLGRGRAGDRSWTDISGLEEALQADPATTGVISVWHTPEPVKEALSPAALEKELKGLMKGKEAKAFVDKFTTRIPGRLKVVSAKNTEHSVDFDDGSDLD